jgi:hypothetical protein
MVFNEDIINADLCHQIIERLVNNKLEIKWNEAEGSKIHYDTDGDMEIQRKSKRRLGWICSPRGILKPCKSRIWVTSADCSVAMFG